MNQRHSSLAISWARALLELATEKGEAEPLAHDLGAVVGLMDDQPDFGRLVSDPALGTEQRARIVQDVFQGRVSPLLWNFLGVLNGKGRMGILAGIASAYDDLLSEQLGIVEVNVTSARPLGDGEMAQVALKIGQATGKQAVVRQFVDESIIGGLVLRLQDKLIDGSVRSQIRALKERMALARPA